MVLNKPSPITKIWSRAKIGLGGPKLAAINGLCGCGVFTSKFEATGSSNRRHQQGVVSERGQQASGVLKEAYTRGRKCMHGSGFSCGLTFESIWKFKHKAICLVCYLLAVSYTH